MAIKTMRVSFDVPIEQLMLLAIQHNSGMSIDVYGDSKPPKGMKALNGKGHPAVALLAPPAKNQDDKRGKNRAVDPKTGLPTRAVDVILRTLWNAPQYLATTTEIRPAVIKAGCEGTTTNSQLSILKKAGTVKQIGRGSYQLTAQGIRDCKKNPVINVPEGK